MTTPEDHSYRSRPLDEDLAARLASMLNQDAIDDGLAEEIQTAVETFVQRRDAVAADQPAACDHTALKAVEARAAALAAAIADLQPDHRNALAAADSDLPEILNRMPADLVRLRQAATDALDNASKKPVDILPLHELVHRLMQIFERVTGKEASNSWDPKKNAYFGPFYDFTAAVVRIAASGETYDNRTLGQQITRALASARKIYGDFLARSHRRSPRIFIDPRRE